MPLLPPPPPNNGRNPAIFLLVFSPIAVRSSPTLFSVRLPVGYSTLYSTLLPPRTSSYVIKSPANHHCTKHWIPILPSRITTHNRSNCKFLHVIVVVPVARASPDLSESGVCILSVLTPFQYLAVPFRKLDSNHNFLGVSQGWQGLGAERYPLVPLLPTSLLRRKTV